MKNGGVRNTTNFSPFSFRIEQLTRKILETHKDRPVCLNARGYKCAGPGIETNGLILEPCPNGVIVELDTAILNNSRGRKVPTLSLDSRCVKCHAEMRMRQLAKRFDSPQKLDYDLAKLGDEFATAASERWSYPLQYARYESAVRKPVRDMRRNGTHTGPRKFVIIDTEFNPTTRELYETAIIDRVTGEVLINTVIRHTDATKTAPLRPEKSQSEARSALPSTLSGTYPDWTQPQSPSRLPAGQVGLRLFR
jgi:hypothetical protein